MHHLARRSPLAGLAVALALGLQFVLVPTAQACSCVGPQSMAAHAGEPTAVIFTGIVQPRDGRGFPITVTRWFQGGGILDGRVWFDTDGFNVNPGVMSSCGIDPLPVGGEWIFVAYRIEGRDELGMGGCSPHAPLAIADGQAMLADAVTTFGGAPPVPDATNAPNVETPVVNAVFATILPIIVAVVAAVGAIAGALVVIGRRGDA